MRAEMRAAVSKPGMKRWQFVLVATSAITSATTSNMAQGIDSAPRFASVVELISLNVTVTDQSRECLTGSPAYWSAGWDGCPVNDLAQDAFRISEDGVPQTVTLFNREDVSIAMSLLIDKRFEAKAPPSEVTRAAAGLIKKLRARDTVAVMDFVSTPNALPDLFKRQELPPSSPNEVRRHAIVFLTDGAATFDPSVLLLARRSGASVYVIGLMRERPLEESREPALSLRQLANLTGGRAFFPNDARRLNSVYNQIYEELSRQYTIGYVSTNLRRDGSWRNVIVQVVDRRDTSARTKQGYFAPEP
jgi:hypothetical protein